MAHTMILDVAGKLETLDVGRPLTAWGETLWRGPGRSFVLRDSRGTFHHDGLSRETAGKPARLVGEVWA